MKKALLLCAFLAVGAMFAGDLSADEYVRGYMRRDGTIVQPYYRSSPNSNYNDNWSVSPNTNPYTGRQGTRAPTWDNRPPPRSNGLGGNSSYNPYGNQQRRY